MNKPITICIIDHLNLISKAYPLLLQEYSDLKVIIIGGTMAELKTYIAGHPQIPEVFLIDIQLLKNNSTNMVRWLHDTYPASKLIAISDSLKHARIHAMLVAGCVAFFGMNIQVSQLYQGICDVYNDCFYSRKDDFIDKDSFMKALIYNGYPVVVFNLIELDIIDYLCTELTYEEIDLKMGFQKGGTNYYADKIFKTLGIHSRNELIKIALHHGLIEELV